jgi:hypothetical protein
MHAAPRSPSPQPSAPLADGAGDGAIAALGLDGIESERLRAALARLAARSGRAPG